MANAGDITSALARPQTLADDWPQLLASDDWQPGQLLGPYRLTRRLGQGGMGVVWLAEQLQPFQRDVAIKVLVSDRRDAIGEAWFEVERQALAQLSHRGIAQIYDAGRLPDGALFFAMEYVPGVPLDEFQLQHALDRRALAALFVQICAAVQHAHQRGLIHRDLKPANVLVQQLDGGPVAKIIDFGVAVRGLPGTAVQLGGDRVVGTRAYMSPEQRQPGAQGIDARSDIYALGVMLAEALCRVDAAADAASSIDASGVHDAVQLALGQGEAIAKAEIEALRTSLKSSPRELLAIAAQAMADDREQRYESAAALADDLSNWLASRPVRAVSQSKRYVLSCLIRRHRVTSIAVVLVTLAVLLGTAMAVLGMTQAQTAKALAEQRRNDAERLIQYMLGDFADKLRPIGRLDLLDSIGGEALKYLSAQGDDGDAGSALSRARALRTLGEVQVTRQQFDRANDTLSRAAELLQPSAANTNDPDWAFESGQIAFWRGSIAYRAKDWAATGRYWQQYLSDSQEFARLSDDHDKAQTELASAYNNLGTLAKVRGELAGALDYFQRAADIKRSLMRSPGDPVAADLANSLAWIANAQAALGQTGEAWLSAREALGLLAAPTGSAVSGRERQREINLRYMLADYARLLGAEDRVRSYLTPALKQAGEDVQADPSQPRRQAMVARIGYTLALAESSPQGAELAWAAGERAMNKLAPGSLGQAEVVELSGLRCLAMQSRIGIGDDRLTAWEDCAVNVLAEETVGDPILLSLQVRLVNQLHRIAPNRATSYVPMLTARLIDLGDAQQRSLRFLEMRALVASMQPTSAPSIENEKQQFEQARASAWAFIQQKEQNP